MAGIAQILGQFAADTTFERLPIEVVIEAKRRLLDVIGIGLSASTTKKGKEITQFVQRKKNQGNCLIWGSSQHTNALYSAFANGTMTFHLELDDVHRTSHTHPGVSVIPTAIALCEEHKLSGRDLVVAIVVGYDLLARVGLAVSPSIYTDRTFLAPGTLAAIGAAAAAAKLKKLTADQIAGAIAATTYIAPIAPFESFSKGAPIKEIVMGWSAITGMHAADLAASGFSGPVSAFEGDFGFFKTVSDNYDSSRITVGIGEEYEILKTGIKPYACCRQHHSAIDAMFDLRTKHSLKPEDVKTIKVRTFKVASRGNDKNPNGIAAAKYSLPYTMAVSLIFGEAWREQYSIELINDPKVRHLASKVEVISDQALEELYDEKWPAIVEVELMSGKKIESVKYLPHGEPEFPMTAHEIEEKFLSLAQDAVSRERAERIMETISNIDKAENLDTLAAELRH